MKYVIALSILGLWSQYAFAQEDSTEKKKVTFTVGATYANDASYYGQRAEESMPYVAASATFRLPFGLYVSGLGYRLLNDSGRVVSASAVSAGFSFNISKKLTADLSYSHTFYPEHSPFLQAASPDMASASLSYEYWMTTGVNVDYAFGKEQDIFVTLSTEKFINLGHLFSEKDFVSLTPSVEIVGGTQHFYETYVAEKRLRDSLLGILPLPLPVGQDDEPATTTTTSTSFDLLSYNLRIPLAYNRANYLVEAACQFSVPGKQAQAGAGRLNTFLNFSFYYQF